MTSGDSKNCFVLRIAPSEVDRVDEAVAQGQLIIGWANAEGLLDPNLDWEQFREIIRSAYHSEDSNLRRSGAAAGHMWRFIREMNEGDLVVVPHGSEFYVGEVAGPASYDSAKIEEDSAYRRPAKWLNGGLPIPRKFARSALIARMKSQGTCTGASDLLEQIRECLESATAGVKPSFESDLQARLVRETLEELRNGRMEDFGFEILIRDVLIGLGAEPARIVPRNADKGADVVATFRVAGIFSQIVAVQAKHWQAEPPVGADVVEQLIRGLEAEEATLGMIITSGTIGTDAIKRAAQYRTEKGVPIELVDGEQFAKMIVEHGIGGQQK